MTRYIDAETAVSLLLRLRDHEDGQAWASFVDIYAPMIYDFCRLKNLQPTDAADTTQNVLLRVSRAIRTFEYDRSRGLFRDWLARIVLNEIRRTAGAKIKENLSHEVVAEADLVNDGQWSEHFHRHVFEVAIELCKKHFEKQTWVLFEDSWLKKKSNQDVAELHGVGVEKIYVARSRVLKRLRHEVTILSDESPFI